MKNVGLIFFTISLVTLGHFIISIVIFMPSAMENAVFYTRAQGEYMEGYSKLQEAEMKRYQNADKIPMTSEEMARNSLLAIRSYMAIDHTRHSAFNQRQILAGYFQGALLSIIAASVSGLLIIFGSGKFASS